MAQQDNIRYAFKAEWYDPNAALIRKYEFYFYPSDNSVEMYDLKNRRIFLKRTKNDSVEFKDLYVNSTINLHSRQLSLVEYADDFTRKQLSTRKERTLALIKPDAISKFGPIIDAISTGGFNITNAKMTRLSRGDAEAFYAEHSGKPFYDPLVRFMTSGPIIAMELMGDNTVAAWRTLLGPTDSARARSEAPRSIRARFGTDQTQNACHGSDSPESAEREAQFFFGADAQHKNTASLVDCSCCVIKPTAVKEGKAGQIMSAICENGFEVSALQMFHMEKANAEEFFEVYKGVVAEYKDMVTELCSGPCFALEISGKGQNTPQVFREFTGPYDPEIARHLRKHTLRANYGFDKVKNSVHCTDLAEDGQLEVEYFFRILSD